MTKDAVKPRILLWDLETAPMVVTSWQLYKPTLSYDNIRQESYLLSAAWKWLDETPVFSASVTPSRPRNDKPVVTALHAVLLQADVLVAHNGDRFDLRRFNTAAVTNGLPPIPKIPTVDTLKVARKHFAFSSNRLDYLGKLLCGARKTETRYELWLRCMDGDEEAIRDMVTYNRNDVLLLESVYKKLLPYIDNHPNVAALPRTGAECPKCGSVHTLKRDVLLTRTRVAEKRQCRDCGGYFSITIQRRDYTPPVKKVCPECASSTTKKCGSVYTRRKDSVRIQPYLCRSCGRSFSEEIKREAVAQANTES